MLISKVIGTKKTLTITSSPYTYTDITDVPIPLSDTTAYGKTIEASDLPVFSFQPESVKYVGRVCVSGQNTSGGNVTIYYTMYKTPSGGSRTQIATNNSSVTTGNYFHVDCSFLDVAVGDQLEVSVWGSSNTNVILISHTVHIAPTRILPTSKNVVDVSETYTSESVKGTVPSAQDSAQGSRAYNGNGDFSPTATTYSSQYARSFITTYNISRYGMGDYSTPDSAVIRTSTYILSFGISLMPTSISYRELSL